MKTAKVTRGEKYVAAPATLACSGEANWEGPHPGRRALSPYDDVYESHAMRTTRSTTWWWTRTATYRTRTATRYWNQGPGRPPPLTELPHP